VAFRDTTSTSWKENTHLVICIALSATIGALCGGAAIALLVYLGMRALIRFNQRLSEDRKIAVNKLESRWQVYIDSIEADHRKDMWMQWEADKARQTGVGVNRERCVSDA